MGANGETPSKTEKGYRIFFWVALAGIVFYFLIHEQVVQQQFEMIQRNSNRIIRVDSLAREVEKMVIDSLKDWREGVEQRQRLDSIEIQKLRRQNEKLEKAYRDLDFSDRPRF